MSNETKKTALPKLRFPEFQEAAEWSIPTLGEISEPVLEKVGNLLLPTVSITAGTGFVLQSDKFGRDISGEQYKRYTLLRKGELAYNKGNSKRYPEGCIYQLKEFEQAATPNVFFSFRFKSNFFAGFYQGYFDNNYHGNQLKKFITSGARSNGLLNISSKAFFSIELPTPNDIAEQQKVAATLSSLNDLITAETAKLVVLQAHKRGVMQELLPAEGETVPKLRFPEFWDAEEWKVSTLVKLASFRRGSFPQPYGLPEWYDEVNGMPFIQVFDVDDNFRLKPKTKNNISKLAAKQSVFIPKETVIVTLQGSIGRVAITQYDAYIDRTLLLFEGFAIPMDKTFFGYVLFLLFEIEKEKAPGGVIKTITKEVLSDFTLSIPSIEEQKKIAACLSSLDDRMTAQTQKIEALKLHKKGLMQNLFPAAAEPTT
jgi:type I restriction enzyme S subunit